MPADPCHDETENKERKDTALAHQKHQNIIKLYGRLGERFFLIKIFSFHKKNCS